MRVVFPSTQILQGKIFSICKKQTFQPGLHTPIKECTYTISLDLNSSKIFGF